MATFSTPPNYCFLSYYWFKQRSESLESAIAMLALSELSDFTPENIQKACDFDITAKTSNERETGSNYQTM